MDEQKQQKISFKQMIEDAKDEMQHMLPGLMKKVTDGKHTALIESPEVFDRSTFKVNIR